MDEGNSLNYYITTPIYYVNAEPHLGGIYTSLLADILARFHRLNDRRVKFVTGTDEHGQKIQQSAQSVSLEEQVFVDMMAKKFQQAADHLEISYSKFWRTTNIGHKNYVQKVWERLVENNWIYRGKYSGWYCVSDEAYYTEDELEKLPTGEFRTNLGKTVEWREEDSYFFRLGKFQKILLDLYKNTDLLQPPSRRNEVIAFIAGRSIKEVESGVLAKGFLKDLSISRNNFSWGIKIPSDNYGKKLISDGKWLKNLEDSEKHIIYVWLDALFNYHSSIAVDGDLGEFWEKATVIHLLGKDILKFHAVYWPALLLALVYSVNTIATLTWKDVWQKNILPATIFAHGWWTVAGRKMSKSLGNVLQVEEEIQLLIGKFNVSTSVMVDYFRYYLATEVSPMTDGDYSRDKFVTRINTELVNNIGNLLQRVLVMVYRSFGGQLRAITMIVDEKVKNLLVRETLNKFNYGEYRDLLLSIATFANGYMEKKTPWNLLREQRMQELRLVLEKEVSYLIQLAILLQPFCPFIAGKILDYFHLDDRSFKVIYMGKFVLPAQLLAKPEIFFPRLSGPV